MDFAQQKQWTNNSSQYGKLIEQSILRQRYQIKIRNAAELKTHNYYLVTFQPPNSCKNLLLKLEPHLYRSLPQPYVSVCCTYLKIQHANDTITNVNIF